MKRVSYDFAAKALDMTVRELMPWLRELGWVNGRNEPMHDRCQLGHMVRWRHQYRDSTGAYQPAKYYTGRLTGRGLYELKKLLGVNHGRSGTEAARAGSGGEQQPGVRPDDAEQGADARPAKRVGHQR